MHIFAEPKTVCPKKTQRIDYAFTVSCKKKLFETVFDESQTKHSFADCLRPLKRNTQKTSIIAILSKTNYRVTHSPAEAPAGHCNKHDKIEI